MDSLAPPRKSVDRGSAVLALLTWRPLPPLSRPVRAAGPRGVRALSWRSGSVHRKTFLRAAAPDDRRHHRILVFVHMRSQELRAMRLRDRMQNSIRARMETPRPGLSR